MVYDKKDIQKFLLDKGILWNGECQKSRGTTFSAYMLFDGEKVPKEVFVNVSPTSFVMFEETFEIFYEDEGNSIDELADYSKDWMICLINKSPENAKEIKQQAQEKIETINFKLENELKELEAQKSLTIAKYNNFQKPWKEVISTADQALKQSSIKQQAELEKE